MRSTSGGSDLARSRRGRARSVWIWLWCLVGRLSNVWCMWLGMWIRAKVLSPVITRVDDDDAFQCCFLLVGVVKVIRLATIFCGFMGNSRFVLSGIGGSRGAAVGNLGRWAKACPAISRE